jgi:acyl-CoA synthetase (NDP forming)
MTDLSRAPMQSQIRRLLRPRSLAIVGASADAGTVGFLIMGNLLKMKYPGKIHLVSRSKSEINGHPCVPTIDDLPPGIDAVALVVPEADMADSIAACARRQVGGVIALAAGFAEMGDEGKEKQEKLASAARAGNIALLGPNCIGMVNYREHVALTFNQVDDLAPGERTGVGVIAQSGAMTGIVSNALAAQGLSLTCLVSTGNEAVTQLEDYLEFLLADVHTTVIVLFVEQVRNPRRFMELAARARELKKPLVMLHPGRTERARASGASHTGALAGNYAVMRALLAREAVVLVNSLDELFDATAMLARWPQGAVRGTSVITNSGGFRSFALDFCEEAGLDFAPIENGTRESLAAMLPPYASADNPLDLTTAGIAQPNIAAMTAEVMLADPNVGSTIISLIAGPPKQQIAKATGLVPIMAASDKPIAFVMLGDRSALVPEFHAIMEPSGMPWFRSADRAMRAMALLTRYGRALAAVRQTTLRLSAQTARIKESGTLTEFAGKRHLAKAGIRIPRGDLAHSADHAAAIADNIGYPVVLKAQAAALSHKSDAGGVALNIGDAAALQKAWDRMHERIAAAMPGLKLDGVLVERMSAPGIELILGARRDPDWGVVLMAGLGGIWTEALNDVRIFSPELSRDSIVAELRQLKGASVLAGARGGAALDLHAVAGAALILAAMLQANPELTEIDINPLIARPAGQGVEALDALLVFDK